MRYMPLQPYGGYGSGRQDWLQPHAQGSVPLAEQLHPALLLASQLDPPPPLPLPPPSSSQGVSLHGTTCATADAGAMLLTPTTERTMAPTKQRRAASSGVFQRGCMNPSGSETCCWYALSPLARRRYQ